MRTERLQTILENHGLSPYQTDAYVTLLELGSASASQIVEKSSVPQPRIYDVLETLEREGYVETFQQDSLQARVHDPAGLTADLTSSIDDLQNAAAEVQERWRQPNVDDASTTIVSQFDTILRRTESLVEEAQYELELSLSPSHFNSLRPLLEAAYERGVRVHVALHSRDVVDSFPDSDEFEGVCSEVRARSRPVPFLALADQRQVCYAPRVKPPNEYGVIIDDQRHAYVFRWFYLTSLWELWEPIYEDGPLAPPTTYLGIRSFIRDIKPHLEADASVEVRVVGHTVRDGLQEDVTGEVTDLLYEETPESFSLLSLAGQAAFELETSERTLAVGGSNSLVEDVEVHRILLKSMT